jgi:hypothetical protein
MTHDGRKIEGLPTNKWRDRILGFFISVFFLTALTSTGLAFDYYENWKEEIGIRYAAQVQAREWEEAYGKLSSKNLMPIITRLQSRLDPMLAREIADAIQKYSNEYKLPPELVIHIIDRESRFRPLAKSKADAVGLMQIMTKAHKDKLKKMNISPEEAYHIDNNVKLGCWIFREYFDKEKDIKKTLLRYVGGNHEKYVEDILIAFTNEAIIGVKVERKEDGEELSRDTEGERGLEAPTVYERERELKEKIVTDEGDDKSG